MVALIELRERSAAVEGVKTSMSRWKSSHQKGVESMESAYGVVHAWVGQKHLNCYIFKCFSLPVNASFGDGRFWTSDVPS